MRRGVLEQDVVAGIRILPNDGIEWTPLETGVQADTMPSRTP